MPRFLSAGRARPSRPDAAELSADRAASAWTGSGSDARIATGRHAFSAGEAGAARRVVREAGAGAALPAREKRRAEARYGLDAERIRIHRDAGAERVTRAHSADAVTAGRDIFFARGRYAPGTREGERLLAHELAHVAQQDGEPRAAQCDKHESQPALLGVFGVDMATAVIAGRPGMNVDLSFDPDPAGPYSTQIGLVQIADVTDLGGRSTAAGQPVDWTNVGTGDESPRMDTMTTGGAAASRGWFVDALYAQHPQSSNVEPSYEEPDAANPTPGGYGDYGWLRSPTDKHPATLTDGPSFSMDVTFDFQTLARGVDNQAVYGGLEWGFDIRGGVVQNDYAQTMTTSTAAFGEALERFRGYFAHEDVILYFDTDIATPASGESAKLADVPSYLSRYPDVRIEITGYADERGSTTHNSALSLNRAMSVQSLLVGMGVDPGKIDVPIGMSETTGFAPGSPVAAPGSLTANRRVAVRFVRTASTPINAP